MEKYTFTISVLSILRAYRALKLIHNLQPFIAKGNKLAFTFVLILSLPAHADTLISDRKNLRSQHILDRFTVTAPDHIVSIIKQSNFGYSLGELGEQKIAIFTERSPCPSYGCTIVIMKVEKDQFFDPILFLSPENSAPFSHEYERIDEEVFLCLTGQMAFPC